MRTVRPDHNSGGNVVIRPALTNRAGGAGIGEFLVKPWFAVVAAMLTVVGVAAARADLSPSNLGLVGVGIFCLGLFGTARLAYANTSMYVKSGHFGRTNLLGMTKEWSLENVGQMRLMAVRFGRTGTVPKLIVLSRRGQVLMQISPADTFSINDLQRLAAAGGFELSGSWDDLVSPTEAGSQFSRTSSLTSRGIMSWYGLSSLY